jgi:hypothetical protein
MGTQDETASVHAATEAVMASQDGSEAVESVSNTEKEQSQSKSRKVSLISINHHGETYPIRD